MFWQIKAATRMTNWDAHTIIPSFDFLYCHCYQLDIWMKNQLRNFDPFKNRKTNSVIRKSLEEYRTLASPYAAHLPRLWGEGIWPPHLPGQDCALDQAAQGPAQAQMSLLPEFWAWCDRGKDLFFSAAHRAHPPSWLARHFACFKKKQNLGLIFPRQKWRWLSGQLYQTGGPLNSSGSSTQVCFSACSVLLLVHTDSEICICFPRAQPFAFTSNTGDNTTPLPLCWIRINFFSSGQPKGRTQVLENENTMSSTEVQKE